MYLEMQVVDEPMVEHDAESKYYGSAAFLESPSEAEDERERLVELLQCAYSWSRVQALRQVSRWLEMESGRPLDA